MIYFYVKRKSKENKEVIGGYTFTKGVLCIEDNAIAAKMSNNLCKYYGVKMSDKSPEELIKSKSKIKK